MRIEGQSKLGYFPTPEITLNLLTTWMSAPTDGQLRRYLDPCCGQGESLAVLAGGQGETFGIELSNSRAEAAEDRLGHVINAGFEYVHITGGTFSFLLLNPPYDGEESTGGGKRMEETFLVDLPGTESLCPSGVLCYIIPHKRINERIARHLAGWYSDLRAFLLP